MTKELSPAEKAWEKHEQENPLVALHGNHLDFLVGFSAGEKHGELEILEKARQALVPSLYPPNEHISLYPPNEHINVGWIRQELDKLEAGVKDGKIVEVKQ